jgi:hypothetical protein
LLGRLWLYPLERVADPQVPTKAYPLTEEGLHLLLNAIPLDG